MEECGSHYTEPVTCSTVLDADTMATTRITVHLCAVHRQLLVQDERRFSIEAVVKARPAVPK